MLGSMFIVNREMAGQMENQMPISHFAKAGATKMTLDG